MPPSKPGDTFIVPIILHPVTMNDVLQGILIQESNPEDERLAHTSRMRADLRKRWNYIGTGRFLIKNGGWMPMQGGFTFKIFLGQPRASALFKDHEAGTFFLKQDETRRRGTMVLQQVEGTWYAHIRYRDGATRSIAGAVKGTRRKAEEVNEEAEDRGVPTQAPKVYRPRRGHFLPRHPVHRVERGA